MALSGCKFHIFGSVDKPGFIPAANPDARASFGPFGLGELTFKSRAVSGQSHTGRGWRQT